MDAPFDFALDRSAGRPLAVQIHIAIRNAIRDGRLREGARLPSWRDLAAQLGVSRGTVRVAYERLIDEQLIASAGAAGTRVVGSAIRPLASCQPIPHPFPEIYNAFGAPPLPFQNGVPAQDAFPLGLWSRLLVRGARATACAPVGYPDPRGDPDLRREIAAYLAVARGLSCDPSQVLVTAGFAGALGLILATLGHAGQRAWLEDPGFPLTRAALERAGLQIAPVPVDGEGLDVAAGIATAPDAKLAVVTPGQHAPLGHVMSLARRRALLDWATQASAWIVEDDYLGELQMDGRAAPALMSLDRHDRVIHAGTFSKTISPALRLGFVVAPPALASPFAETAAVLAPGPTGAVGRAVSAFLAEGHHLRHLRRMKRLYTERRRGLVSALEEAGIDTASIENTGGFAIRLILPNQSDDVAVARRAAGLGLSVVPLSPWSHLAVRRGLLLGFTNFCRDAHAVHCRQLVDVIAQDFR